MFIRPFIHSTSYISKYFMCWHWQLTINNDAEVPCRVAATMILTCYDSNRILSSRTVANCCADPSHMTWVLHELSLSRLLSARLRHRHDTYSDKASSGGHLPPSICLTRLATEQSRSNSPFCTPTGNVITNLLQTVILWVSWPWIFLSTSTWNIEFTPGYIY